MISGAYRWQGIALQRFSYLETPFVAFSLAAVLLLSACATRVPDSIRHARPSEVGVTEVRAGDAQRYAGAHVRWGGIIAAVENRPSETTMQVVSLPLDEDGRPQAGGDSGGRFLAKFPGFIDPMIYEEGRHITVVGTLRGKATRKIGEYAYSFPVVEMESHHLWEGTNRSKYEPSDWWRYSGWPYPYYRYPWPYGPYYW